MRSGLTYSMSEACVGENPLRHRAGLPPPDYGQPGHASPRLASTHEVQAVSVALTSRRTAALECCPLSCRQPDEMVDVRRAASGRRVHVVDDVPRWRIGIDVRSADVGAAAAFAQVVDFDDQPPLPVPGLVGVLRTWLWQEGPATRWWLGAIVEARSAVAAEERVGAVVEARTASVRTVAVTIHATASTARTTQERLDEEDVDLHAVPGPPRRSSSRCRPVRTRAAASALRSNGPQKDTHRSRM